MRSTLAAALLVACVVLAGCGGVGTTTTAPATDTPDPGGTETVTTARPTVTQSAPGNLTFRRGARVGIDVLGSAHAAALYDRSYTLRLDRGVGTATTKVGEHGLYSVRPANVNRTAYMTADAEFRRERDGDAVRTVARPRTREVRTGTRMLAALRSPLVVTGTVERGGETRYVLTTGANDSDVSGTVGYVRAVADGSGLVHDFAAGYVRDGETTVTESFTLADVGSTTVDAPDWVATVRDAPVDPAAGTGTVVVENTAVEATLRVTTTARDLRYVDLRRNENEFRRGGFVSEARVSPLVDPVVRSAVENATVTVGYDESALPAGASEANVSLFVYNETLQTFLQLHTTVDAANDTLTASEAFAVTDATGGTERTVTPPVVAPGARTTVVALHVPTYVEAVRSG